MVLDHEARNVQVHTVCRKGNTERQCPECGEVCPVYDRRSNRTWAPKGWGSWLSWVMHYQLEPVKAAAKTIRKHLWGILNVIVPKVTNGLAEGVNSRIKIIKVQCIGLRNKQRFTNAIYLCLGGLDM